MKQDAIQEDPKTGKRTLINPRTGGTILDDVTDEEALAIVLGFTPIRIAQEQDLTRMAYDIMMKDRSLRGGVTDRLVELRKAQDKAAVADNQEELKRLFDLEDTLWAEAEERGVAQGLSRSVRGRYKTQTRPQLDRLIRMAPRRLRERLEEEVLGHRLTPPPPKEK